MALFQHTDDIENNISIDRLRQGNEAELESLYRLWFPHFLQFALSFLKGDEAVSRDIVQEVFIAYWQRRTEFADLVGLKVFFYRSIRNRCLNELRSQQTHAQTNLAEAERMESLSVLEEAVIREEVAMAVRHSVDTLPPQSRRVLLLALAGKRNSEIAQELQLSVNTVKTHKQKAYLRLRQMLSDIRLLLSLVAV